MLNNLQHGKLPINNESEKWNTDVYLLSYTMTKTTKINTVTLKNWLQFRTFGDSCKFVSLFVHRNKTNICWWVIIFNTLIYISKVQKNPAWHIKQSTMFRVENDSSDYIVCYVTVTKPVYWVCTYLSKIHKNITPFQPYWFSSVWFVVSEKRKFVI